MGTFLTTLPVNLGYTNLGTVEAYPTGGTGPTAYGPTSYFGSDPLPPDPGSSVTQPVDLGQICSLLYTIDINNTHGGKSRLQSSFYKLTLTRNTSIQIIQNYSPTSYQANTNKNTILSIYKIEDGTRKKELYIDENGLVHNDFSDSESDSDYWSDSVQPEYSDSVLRPGEYVILITNDFRFLETTYSFSICFFLSDWSYVLKGIEEALDFGAILGSFDGEIDLGSIKASLSDTSRVKFYLCSCACDVSPGLLPCAYPPYGCNTDLNTSCVETFGTYTGQLSGLFYLTEQNLTFTGGSTVPSEALRTYSSYVVGGSGVDGLASVQRGYDGAIASIQIQDGTGYLQGDTIVIPAADIGDTVDVFIYLSTSIGLQILGAWENCTFTSFPKLDTSSGTNFDHAWLGCSGLTSFPELDTSFGTTFSDSWSNCSGLTSFPLLNVSSGTNFYNAWSNCSSLTSFPTLNTSSGTNFGSTWAGCSGLTSFPLLNVSSGTNFYNAWSDCYGLPSFPTLSTNSGINFDSAWLNCSGLTSFPSLNFSSGKYFGSAWFNCSNLVSFPSTVFSSGIDFSSAWAICSGLSSFLPTNFNAGKYFKNAWAYCSSLVSFPLIQVSSGIDFESAWQYCSNLTSFPAVLFSSGTNFKNSWQSCSSLTSFSATSFGSGVSFEGAWQNCSSLTSFPAVVFSSGTDFDSAWEGCSSLTSFSAVNFTSGTAISFVKAWKNCTSFTSFPSLNATSSRCTFTSAWENCTGLTSFPLLTCGSESDFTGAWKNCTNLTTFPAHMFDTWSSPGGVQSFSNSWYNCALNQTSVDNILVSINASGAAHGTPGYFYLNLDGGTSSAPGAAGLAAKAALEAKRWIVYVNTPVTPTSGLSGWWDASDSSTLTVVGGAVSQWNDKSGNGWNVSQSNAALRPSLATGAINSKDALLWPSTPGDGFGGGGNAKQLFSSRTDNFTVAEIYAVVKYTDTSLGGFPGLFNAKTYYTSWITGQNASSFVSDIFDQYFLNGGSTNKNGSLFPELSSTCLIRANLSGGGSSISTTGLSIGMDRDYGSLGRGWRGYICEILAYAAPLSSGDRTTLTGVLQAKWGF